MNKEEIIKRVSKYFEEAYEKNPPKRKKVFYNWNEWSGLRFYKKAILNRDWKSIKGHIKSKINQL